MKQILQNLSNGQTSLTEVPAPQIRAGHVLVQTRASVVSVGTERMLVEFGKANFLDKARQQPEKVRQVLDKIRTDGVAPTIQAVKSKLDQPMPLGYSNAGVVIAVGTGVSDLEVGDRVVTNGPHAQLVLVPENLCARIPSDRVTDVDAAFTVLGSIALQGVRLASPTLGESFVVIGLGLIGLLTVQILRAAGCRVLGLDFDPRKLELAREFGAQTFDLSGGVDPIAAATSFSNNHGVDGVLITASTKSSDPVHQAATMCRKRGRIVLVGVTGLELSRKDFYEKELTFQVSCSYGPGRYDPNYEQRGNDYPIGFVRWTEKRNFEAVLNMLEEQQLNLEPIITHEFDFEKAEEAYSLITNDNAALGVVLKYRSDNNADVYNQCIQLDPKSRPVDVPRVGLIGAGSFTTQILLPAIRATGAELSIIASNGGVSASHAGRKFGFSEATTDSSAVFARSMADVVVIATRHDTHSRFLKRALEAGQHAFVEKPLALTRDELTELEAAYASLDQRPLVHVGFNRRFAPLSIKLKSLLSTVNEQKAIIATVNAGHIPFDHWTQDPEVGGGRIIGEACHFVDLLRYFVGHPIVNVHATVFGGTAPHITREDKMTITLSFEDGSFGTIHYLANGHKGFPKERFEVFSGGRILVLDNFRKLTGYGWKSFKTQKLWKQDKGHTASMAAFINAVKAGGPPPIPFSELLEVSRACFTATEIARAQRNS